MIILNLIFSCDQVNNAYLQNESGYSIKVQLFFNDKNINIKNIKPNSNNDKIYYIYYLIKDSLIKDNVKVSRLSSTIVMIEFVLTNKSKIKLIYDTAPLRKSDIQFDSLKIYSKWNQIVIVDKDSILNSFKPISKETERYLIINNR